MDLMSQLEAAQNVAVMGICVCINEDEWIHKLAPLQKANTSVVLSLLSHTDSLVGDARWMEEVQIG